MTQPDATQLHQFLVDHFNLEELKTLCFNLGVEYEDLGGEGRSDKARELVLLMKRQTRLHHLDETLAREQPDAYGKRFGQVVPLVVHARMELPNRRIHEKTGIELIRIPAGPFLFGSASNELMTEPDEWPQRSVDVPEYWIGRAPLTNDQFAHFVRVTGHRTTAERTGYGWAWTGNKSEQIKGADWLHPGGPDTSSADKGDHPVVQVSWDDAKAYCDWAGLALPTEEQWEKAARGTDGRIWPWDNKPPTAQHCNFNHIVGSTTSVGKYSQLGDSPYGCADMAGNVWEWTDSCYDDSHTRRVIRGGSWTSISEACRCARRRRFYPDHRNANRGFRVVARSS